VRPRHTPFPGRDAPAINFREVDTVQEQTTPGPAGDDIPPQQPRESRKVIHASCSVHQVAMGFTNLVVSKRNGEIVLDPHVDGGCLLTLSEDEACALRDVLTEWLG
jgi:hypothetical protein